MFRGDRIKLLLLASLFAAPALAALFVHQIWTPTPATSYGELLQPAVPQLDGLRDSVGQPADLAALHGRWILLTVVNGECGAACKAELDLARRVRLAQGREQGRVIQALIQSGAVMPDARPDLFRYRVPEAALAHWPDPLRTYVVDPLGRVMLRFPVAVEGQGMLRDLRQLLKASKIG